MQAWWKGLMVANWGAYNKRLWSSGRIPRCHRGDPGSIPGRRMLLSQLARSLTLLRSENQAKE